LPYILISGLLCHSKPYEKQTISPKNPIMCPKTAHKLYQKWLQNHSQNWDKNGLENDPKYVISIPNPKMFPDFGISVFKTEVLEQSILAYWNGLPIVLMSYGIIDSLLWDFVLIILLKSYYIIGYDMIRSQDLGPADFQIWDLPINFIHYIHSIWSTAYEVFNIM